MIGRLWLLGALVLAGIAGCGANAKIDAIPEAPAETYVSVRTEPARRGTSSRTVEGLGRCEALPDRIAALTPAVEGHVHALLIPQGDVVRKGEPIVELDKAVAQADVAEKTGTRDGLKASLDLLKSLPRPAERRANELMVDQAKVTVERSKAVLERIRPLRARHEVSEQQVYDAEKALETAELQRQSAEATLHAMMIGPRAEAIAEAEAKIKTADGLVQFSQAHLDFHTIRAPIDGVLDSLTCHPGETISVGTPIGTVVDTRQIFASIWLPPSAAASVRIGMVAHLGRGYARDTEHEVSGREENEMPGKVTFIGRVADPQTGNLPIRILVDNPQGRLTVGQSVRVSIVVNERKDILQVPAAAVLDLGEGPALRVLRDGKAVLLHPQVKMAHGGSIEIAGTDLKEGERVILDGGYNLPEGTPVKPVEEKPGINDEQPSNPAAGQAQKASEAIK